MNNYRKSVLPIALSIFCVVGGILTVFTNYTFGLALFVGLSLAFLLQGLRQIPAAPPHVGLLKVFGQRTEAVVREGWRFFPLTPWWFDVVLVKIEKINQDLPPQKLRSPDLAELEVPVSITWTPDAESGVSLVQFLNSGGEGGVSNIFPDIIRERLREWAISETEGPGDWQELMRAGEEASAILLKAILGDELVRIPSPIPTAILKRYFDRPTQPFLQSDKKNWGERWEKVKESLPSDPVELQSLKEAVEERWKLVQRARHGNGDFRKRELGIVVHRLNVGEIKVLGKLAEAAEQRPKEEQERRGELFEVDTDLQKAQMLVKAAKDAGETLSLQQAYQVIMEWKATREGRGFTVPGVAPAVAQIAGALFGKLRGDRP
ncbi:MAG: hypothetical protein Q8P01_03880 [bacterium]|nr:hypothetical protein [bacterium]